MRNLILGTINYYNFEQVSKFIYSIKQTNFKGHICLFAGSHISKKTISLIKMFNIEVLRFKETFPFLQNPHPANFKVLPEPIHIYNYRHFLYFDYLLNNHNRFDNVLITDIKDVFFQKDPFDFKIDNAIHVAMENKNIKLGTCKDNAEWIRSGYGNDILEQMKNEVIVCAGTTIAPVRLMLDYLKRLLEEMSNVNNVFTCADQALHNALLFFNQVKPIKKLDNFNGPILTVGTEPNYQLDKKGRLINEDGSIINTIHQYDRHMELINIMNQKTDPYNIKKYLVKIFYRIPF